MAHSSDEPTFEASITGAVTTGTPPMLFSSARQSCAPGAIIAGRYRVVALLGRGGMGEVYRADDLTLDQPVALKFLLAANTSDPAHLARFHNELRVARQVSHKNVCRLYDLGEAEGHRFLTMEYVDGEDLGTLLRRIGRIPHDKGSQIARQLCAGVAAAHERGVLHRDLKPANVMIDGHGDVRITDFGIATASSEASQEFVGTPHYMAPEQFSGGAASIKTDLYALGLILFETFTGRPSQERTTLDDLRRFHQTGTHVTPSSIVKDLDPAVERIIMRCLERDPDRRPPSALAVAAALPGADALADALAAGETPSPALIAAAGDTVALGVLPAVLMLIAAVAGMLVFAWGSSRVSVVGRSPHDLAPAVLIDRATQVARALGYVDPPGDEAYQFQSNGDYLNWVARTRRTPQRWDALPTGYPSALQVWYRTSPGEMPPAESSVVTRTDPPLIYSRMRLTVMDTAGRLLEFRAVPPRTDDRRDEAASPERAGSPSWQTLFDAAALPMTSFVPAVSQWTPPAYADTRLAWEGPMPGSSDQRLRIEAASLLGKPVYFQVVGPWSFPDGTSLRRLAGIDAWLLGTTLTVVLAFILTSVVLARRHLREGRADVKGATTLAIYLGVPMLAAWLLEAHHVASPDREFGSFFRAAARSMLVSLLLWTVYLALEPYVRRFWPHSLLGWSRVLAGRLRDARVGREVLIGVLFGVALALIDVLRATLLPWLGFAAPRVPFASNLGLLSGVGPLIAQWITWGVSAVQYSLLAILIVVVLRLACRWHWLALLLTAVCLSVASWQYMLSSTSWLWAFSLASGALLTFVAVRFGLLTLAVTWFVWSALYDSPMTLNLSHWSATASNSTLALLAILTVFGFSAARGGQAMVGGRAKDA
jgi:serine/threonine-protein kinase